LEERREKKADHIRSFSFLLLQMKKTLFPQDAKRTEEKKISAMILFFSLSLRDLLHGIEYISKGKRKKIHQ